ncbi:hypothetical protein GLOIN_2v1668440, partial [Rhizophagus irregularis DAOM 181602=DAOM 197198]
TFTYFLLPLHNFTYFIILYPHTSPLQLTVDKSYSLTIFTALITIVNVNNVIKLFNYS